MNKKKFWKKRSAEKNSGFWVLRDPCFDDDSEPAGDQNNSSSSVQRIDEHTPISRAAKKKKQMRIIQNEVGEFALKL